MVIIASLPYHSARALRCVTGLSTALLLLGLGSTLGGLVFDLHSYQSTFGLSAALLTASSLSVVWLALKHNNLPDTPQYRNSANG